MTKNSLDHKIIEPAILQSSTVHFNHKSQYVAKGDSGTSQHYISESDKNILNFPTPATNQTVLLPNNQHICLSIHGTLPLSNHLSKTAQSAHVLPKLRTSLISLGQLADDNCIIMLTKQHLKVFKHCRCILNGHQNAVDGLWDIPLQNSSYPSVQKLMLFFPNKRTLRACCNTSMHVSLV